MLSSKSVALIVIVIVVPVFAQPPQSSPSTSGREKISKADHSKNAAQDTRPSRTVASQVNAAPHQGSPEIETGEAKNKSQQTWRDYLGEGFGPATWASWFLGVAAVVAGLIALATLRAISYQARIAKISLHQLRRYVSFTARLAKSAKESADTAARHAELAERALHLTERADVLVDQITISTHPEFTPDSVVKIAFKNYGRTRANRIETTAKLFSPDVATEPNEPPPIARRVVGAGDHYPVVFQPLKRCMTEETFVGIDEGAIALRFEAEIVYYDVFDKRHTTRYGGVFDRASCSFLVDQHQYAD